MVRKAERRGGGGFTTHQDACTRGSGGVWPAGASLRTCLWPVPPPHLYRPQQPASPPPFLLSPAPLRPSRSRLSSICLAPMHVPRRRLNIARVDRPLAQVLAQRFTSSGVRTADGDRADYFLIPICIKTRTHAVAHLAAVIHHVRSKWPWFDRLHGHRHLIAAPGDHHISGRRAVAMNSPRAGGGRGQVHCEPASAPLDRMPIEASDPDDPGKVKRTQVHGGQGGRHRDGAGAWGWHAWLLCTGRPPFPTKRHWAGGQGGSRPRRGSSSSSFSRCPLCRQPARHGHHAMSCAPPHPGAGDLGRLMLTGDLLALTANVTYLTHWGLHRNHSLGRWAAAHRPGQARCGPSGGGGPGGGGGPEGVLALRYEVRPRGDKGRRLIGSVHMQYSNACASPCRG